MYMNLISVWCIVMPLSFLAAFYWKLPVELVVIAVQSDQIFKCLPIFLRFQKLQMDPQADSNRLMQGGEQ